MMAKPCSGTASRIEAFSAATASIEPMPARCARPASVMIAPSGSTISVSGRISPGLLMPISATRNCASSGVESSVSGTPMSLLKLFGLAWVGPASLRMPSRSRRVVVLPALPVTATTRSLRILRRHACASAPSARRVERTRTSPNPACSKSARPSLSSAVSARSMMAIDAPALAACTMNA